MTEERISAFAFNTGRLIEKIIIEHTNNLQEKNKILEAKIMQWYMLHKDKQFAEFMNIEELY